MLQSPTWRLGGGGREGVGGGGRRGKGGGGGEGRCGRGQRVDVGMCWSPVSFLFSNLEAAGGEGGRGTHRGLRRREKQPSGFHSRHSQGSAGLQINLARALYLRQHCRPGGVSKWGRLLKALDTHGEYGGIVGSR